MGDDAGLTSWCVEASKSLSLHELGRKVRVSWNSRMQTTAGRAWWPNRSIELNPKLKECEPEELWRTLKHELAHLVAYERCGRRQIDPHGPEWQAACIDVSILVRPENVYYGDNEWLDQELGLTGWGSRPIPQQYLLEAYITGAPYNESNFSDADVDALPPLILDESVLGLVLSSAGPAEAS